MGMPLLREISYRDEVDAAGISRSPIGYTVGTYSGSMQFSVDSGSTFSIGNVGSVVYADAQLERLRRNLGEAARRSADAQVAAALRTYSQSPTGPMFDSSVADVPIPTATFSNAVESTPLTAENLNRVIEQMRASSLLSSRPDTIILPPSLQVRMDYIEAGRDPALDVYASELYGIERTTGETDEQLRQHMRDRWQTLSPTSTASLSQAITATIHVDEVAVAPDAAEAQAEQLGRLCAFLGRDVALGDPELQDIARVVRRADLALTYNEQTKTLRISTVVERLSSEFAGYRVI